MMKVKMVGCFYVLERGIDIMKMEMSLTGGCPGVKLLTSTREQVHLSEVATLIYH